MATLFRVNKNKNYTVMSNYHLQDKSLSFKAKGLLSFMLSLPDSWDYSMKGLVSVSKENIGAIRTILQELEKHNYLVRTRYQNEKGQFQYEYTIYEIPYDKTPYTYNPYTDMPYSQKDTQINTKIINTNKQDKIDKTNPIINELIKRNFIEITDLDLYSYDSLIKELLNEYDYKQVIISTKYVLSKWIENKGLDEYGNEIKNKFGYFRKSLENNLIRLTEQLKPLDWEL